MSGRKKLLVNLRGTTRQRQDTVARTFMEKFPHEALFMKSGKPAGVRVDVPGWYWPLFIPGKYSNVCGGMNSIKTQAECADRAIKAYEYGHVLAEGLISSGVGPEGTFPATIQSGRRQCAFPLLGHAAGCMHRPRGAAPSREGQYGAARSREDHGEVAQRAE